VIASQYNFLKRGKKVGTPEKHVQDQQKTIGDHWSQKTASHQAGLKL